VCSSSERAMFSASRATPARASRSSLPIQWTVMPHSPARRSSENATSAARGDARNAERTGGRRSPLMSTSGGGDDRNRGEGGGAPAAHRTPVADEAPPVRGSRPWNGYRPRRAHHEAGAGRGGRSAFRAVVRVFSFSTLPRGFGRNRGPGPLEALPAAADRLVEWRRAPPVGEAIARTPHVPAQRLPTVARSSKLLVSTAPVTATARRRCPARMDQDRRSIVVADHGCGRTAGRGPSCGGAQSSARFRPKR
jgi:hypothetical protein